MNLATSWLMTLQLHHPFTFQGSTAAWPCTWQAAATLNRAGYERNFQGEVYSPGFALIRTVVSSLAKIKLWAPAAS
jgi:hypothetical protein